MKKHLIESTLVIFRPHSLLLDWGENSSTSQRPSYWCTCQNSHEWSFLSHGQNRKGKFSGLPTCSLTLCIIHTPLNLLTTSMQHRPSPQHQHHTHLIHWEALICQKHEHIPPHRCPNLFCPTKLHTSLYRDEPYWCSSASASLLTTKNVDM